MAGIAVSVVPPTSEGRLYPRYLNRDGILHIGTRFSRSCPVGFNIDATLILDFDEHRLLAGAELLLPMNRWKGKGSLARPSGEAGDIVLSEPTSVPANHDRDWAIAVSKDVQADAARISFGGEHFDRAVELSRDCYALLSGGRLTGFWFSLARKSAA